MTLKSDQQSTERLVSSRLNAANEQLPDAVKHEIAIARRQALLKARNKNQSPTEGKRLVWQSFINYKFVAPVALAVAILVSYGSRDAIPVLPAELLLADVPAEDLNFIEDLEFATWLAEQEATL